MMLHVDLSALRTDKYAGAEINLDQARATLNAMEEKGIPFVSDGSDLVIGHFRVEVLKRLGHSKVWVVDISTVAPNSHLCCVEFRSFDGRNRVFTLCARRPDVAFFKPVVKNLSMENMKRVSDHLAKTKGCLCV